MPSLYRRPGRLDDRDGRADRDLRPGGRYRPSPGRCLNCCRASRSSTSATRRIPRTARSPSPTCRYGLEVLDTLVDEGVKMLRSPATRHPRRCSRCARALRRAGGRGDRPGRPHRTVDPQPPDRRGRTEGTIGSGVYQDMLGVDATLEVFAQACPRFVEFVEAGVTDSPEVLRRRGSTWRPPPRRRRHARARLHALPVPRGRDQLRDGRGRLARLERHRDRQRRLPAARLTRARRPDATALHTYEATGDSAEDFLRLADRLMGRGVPPCASCNWLVSARMRFN